MSNRHISATFELDVKPRELLVALAMADRACERCGCAWPGRADLMQRTKLGHTSVDEALDALEQAGHVAVIANAKGGRGRATIYICLPGLPGLMAAPCRDCQSRMIGTATRELSGQKPTATREDSSTGKVPPRGSFGAKPPASGAVNVPPGGTQPSVKPETTARAQARTRERPADAAAPHASGHPTQPQSVGATLRRIMPRLTTIAVLDGIPTGQALAATAADRGKAQGQCQGPATQPRAAPIGDTRPPQAPQRATGGGSAGFS